MMSGEISASQMRLRTDQRPLYVQASEALRALVRHGSYQPGDRLPSEIELSRQLGISRPTLREALRLLEEEGVIVRRHGVGTFVSWPGPLIESGLEVLQSIDRMAEQRDLVTGMVELTVEERGATSRELIALGLSGETAVTVVTRVITADGQRIAHLTDVVPQGYLRTAELGPGFHGSVLDHFLGRGWPAFSHSWTELSAKAADAALARALHIPKGAPLLRLEAQLHAQDGAVVDHSLSHFVPGHFRFHVVRRIG